MPFVEYYTAMPSRLDPSNMSSLGYSNDGASYSDIINPAPRTKAIGICINKHCTMDKENGKIIFVRGRYRCFSYHTSAQNESSCKRCQHALFWSKNYRFLNRDVAEYYAILDKFDENMVHHFHQDCPQVVVLSARLDANIEQIENTAQKSMPETHKECGKSEYLHFLRMLNKKFDHEGKERIL